MTGCIAAYASPYRFRSDGIEPVPITIRNSKVEAIIREIGRHTGEGPSAVIARAVENLAGKTFSEKEARTKYERLMRSVPPRDSKLTWEKLRDEMDGIF